MQGRTDIIRDYYTAYYEDYLKEVMRMKYLKKHDDTILFICGVTLVTLGIYWIYKALKK